MAVEKNQERNEWLSRISGFLESASHQRLSSELDPFRKYLETRKNLKGSLDHEEEKWAAHVEGSLDDGETAMNNHKDHLAWNHFHEAVCASAYLLDEEDGSLENLAKITLSESKKKLDSWRREAVIKLLCDEKGELKKVDLPKKTNPAGKQNLTNKNDGKKEPTAESPDASPAEKDPLRKNDVYEALKILTQEFGNSYVKMNIAHKQLEMLIILAIFFVPITVVMVALLPTQPETGNPFFLTTIALFGAIGGIASGMGTISKDSIRGKIPDQLLSSWSTMCKPIFGAISALGVSLFLFAGLYYNWWSRIERLIDLFCLGSVFLGRDSQSDSS